ncbi:adenosylmethionine--8-amino-7-oxononanoate transaminase [Pedobacter sp. MR2016-24]|uniref:adenosylmethionine--8-amino-7-oxononanoate transaminase n=1 Tax=Pedobacter sp. MR2016-24 TaxID=2994466 RepID=UPI002245B8EC|nr:adenosylmethionine--8-amino-7-oxononanoate transaminase [Pedobacter sp. MR2016-24]MCX2483414.1 adenosylmethionine--8-amino-7-oxononanoate transaminase [Pedobacter sp. MR2016-24]
MSLAERDAQIIWHPYTQMQTAVMPTGITSAKGACLYDEEGNEIIDAISSWWVITHGHCHPYITSRVNAQMQKLDQVIFAGFTHEPAVVLAEKLLRILPGNQQKVFYSDNGSTAVEVALKMCLQFWFNSGAPRKKILAFENGYHGDTFGAMSVSSRSAWTAPFDQLLFETMFIPLPTAGNIHLLKAKIQEYEDELACFIYEPLIQGSAGMIMYEASALDQLLEFCKGNQILLIQDEVFTGFGRTGKHFAADHLIQQADIMCFSKGLTGGLMPLGVTTCTDDIYNAFLSQDKLKTLFHGHSFTANPLACTAAAASIDLLLQQNTQDNIARICQQHRLFREKLAGRQGVKDIRQTGTILAIEFYTAESSGYFSNLRDALYSYFLERQILLRPLGNIIYILPPYCIDNQQLQYVYDAIESALAEFSPHHR